MRGPDSQATIMIVDDTPANLKLLECMLRDKGYRTRALPRGRLALKAVMNDPPDLILLDINMPEMDGYRVCRELKAVSDSRVRDIPIIFISALNDVDDKMKAFTSGGVDYITKPFQLEEVQARVKTHLEIRRMQSELTRYSRDLEARVNEQISDILAAKEELSQAQHATILAMSKIAESRDDDTGRHIEITQAYCRVLAGKMGQRPEFRDQVDETFIKNIYNASPLHDIGKVAIPDAVLKKPGKLTPEEFEVIKTHTVIGARQLENVLTFYPNNAFVAMGASIARSHHEKWDGTGYPDGLAGNRIPLCAQIMAVADVYDALRSERCYKKALTHDESRRIIIADTGTHFSPAAGRAFRESEKEFARIHDKCNSRKPDSRVLEPE